MFTAENQVLAGIYLPICTGRGKCKIRGKLVPVFIMKAYSESRGTAPLILNLGARWRLRRCTGDSPNKYYYYYYYLFILFYFFCGAATQRGSWPPHS